MVRKGGSGKTTLGLTIASVLSKAGLNVLLIDSDFSTHGATYFFEEQLPVNKQAISFMKLLRSDESIGDMLSENDRFIGVDKGFKFIPSVKQVSESSEFKDSFDNNETKGRLKAFIEFLKDPLVDYFPKFDLVIFDCQAGMSSLLPSLLPCIDTTLMVLEPDKVSTAALRSLYTQISNYLTDRNVYQVFNKVDKEEQEFYKKLTFGTFFINVGALLYDWSIRKAFAFSIIPNVDDEGLDYGLQICDLCHTIIVDIEIRRIIDRYKESLMIKKKSQELSKLREKVDIIKAKKRIHKVVLSISTIAIIIIIVSMLFYLNSLKKTYPYIIDNDMVWIFGLIILLLGSVITYEIYCLVEPASSTQNKELYRKVHDLEDEIANYSGRGE